MIQESINRLTYICQTLPSLLASISDEEFNHKPLPNKWSKKEILGHLIDSATNNHHRFVRGQFETIPSISYEPNHWNACSFHAKQSTQHLITFWTIYNQQLLFLMQNMPADKLQNICNCGGQENHTLQFIINDYIRHLDHHLKQIVAVY
jgi:hypothetical protein